MKFTLQINRHIHTQTHSLNSRRIVFLLFTFLFIVCCSYSLCMCVYFHESFYFFVLFILFFFHSVLFAFALIHIAVSITTYYLFFYHNLKCIERTSRFFFLFISFHFICVYLICICRHT